MTNLMDTFEQHLATAHATAADYQAGNLARKSLLVHEPGTRGFFAEFSTVAHGMVYAWTHDLQLVLDSSRWGFGFDQGWADYFTPLFREYRPEMEDQVAFRTSDRVSRHATGKHINYHNILFSRPDRVQLGEVVIENDFPINIHFIRMLLQFNPRVRAAITRRIEQLDMPEQFVAVHIRRGDKIGDQDILYPAQKYLEQLGGEYEDLAVFAMSDDYAAIEELGETLARISPTRQLFSITEPRQAGFDADRLTAGKPFISEDFGPDDQPESYVDEEVIRLLTETVIAAQSRFFVGTFFSNVGKIIRMLHPDMGKVRLMRPTDMGSEFR